MLLPLRNRAGVVVAHTRVDDDIDPALVAHRWYRIGRYAGRNDRNRAILLHREIAGLPRRGREPQVDHMNLDGLDNRRVNLRVVTGAQNLQNQPSHVGSTSRYRGVSWKASNKRWRAAIDIDGRTRHLGYFRDEDAAGAVAAEARARHMPFSAEGTRAESLDAS